MTPVDTALLTRRTDRAAYTHGCIVLSLLAVAIATRAGRIGDPAIHMDEQFYLLMADRMWHGVLPYVDLWDRKPILLFLIYAALRPFSPDGIVAYQIGALLFAVLTAYFIVLTAQRFANQTGAWLAGIAYLLYLPVLSGDGGQSPVFYNLFMAIGAWEVIRAGEARDVAGIRRHGLRSMIWAGLAIQVKYTSAIEGAAFGLWLIALLVRDRRTPMPSVLMQAGTWALIALAPTLLALGCYVLIGHGHDFVQANFLSILQKRDPQGFSSLPFLRATLAQLSPLLLVAAASILQVIRNRQLRAAPWPFLLLWTSFAVIEFLAIGNFYDHYALPLLVPAIIICAPLFSTAVGGAAAIVLFGWCAILTTAYPTGFWREFDQARIDAMVKAAQPYASHGCLYLNDGPPIVYLLTHSCLPTRYVFPSHLNEAPEAGATDAARSTAALLASRPSAIFVADKPMNYPRNAITAAMLDAALAKDYVRTVTLPDVLPDARQILYVRKDLLPQPQGKTR